VSNEVKPPKVFISYSWTSQKHQKWVVELAERLSSDGVFVKLDKWDLKEGQDKYAYMEQMVLDPEVKRVLAICDMAYQEKANARKGGVGTESLIISKEIYEKADQEKFIPIVKEFDSDGKPCVPVFFGGRIHIDLSTNEKFFENYGQLIRNIFERPELKRPPIGTPPGYILDPDPVQLKTSHKLDRLKAAVFDQKPYAKSLAQDYVRTFVDAFEDFRIKNDRTPGEPFDEKVLQSITAFLPYRDDFVEFVSFICDHFEDRMIVDPLIHVFEQTLPYQECPASIRSFNSLDYDNYKFINYELFLYCLATLVRAGRNEAAAELMEARFHTVRRLGGDEIQEVTIFEFCHPIDSLDQGRAQRLREGWYSFTATIIRERANRRDIRFRQLQQAEAIVFIRSCIETEPRVGHWTPRTLVFSDNRTPFEIFSRATGPRGLETIQKLFRVKTLVEFLRRLEEAFTSKRFAMLQESRRYEDVHWRGVLNIDALRHYVGAD